MSGNGLTDGGTGFGVAPTNYTWVYWGMGGSFGLVGPRGLLELTHNASGQGLDKGIQDFGLLGHAANGPSKGHEPRDCYSSSFGTTFCHTCKLNEAYY